MSGQVDGENAEVGLKDEKWREAPGYCVECDKLRRLNRSGVCKKCHKLDSACESEWIEDVRSSKLFYEAYLCEEPTRRKRRREASMPLFLIAAYLTGKEGLFTTSVILDFVRAADEEAAFALWKEYLRKEGVDQLEEIFEDEVYIIQISSYGYIFSLPANEATDYVL